jgi:hypothetical protein
MTDDAQPAAAQAGQRLSEAEITVLRAHHQRSTVNPWCRDAGCKQDWPCHTARLIATLGATRADLQQARAEAATPKLCASCGEGPDKHITICTSKDHMRRMPGVNAAAGVSLDYDPAPHKTLILPANDQGEPATEE